MPARPPISAGLRPAFMVHGWLTRLGRFRLWLGRRFTRAGVFLLGVLGLSGLFGMDTTRTMSFQAFTLLFMILAAGLLTSRLRRPRVRIERRLPRYATAGQPLVYRVRLINEIPRLQRGLSLFEDPEEIRITPEEFLKAKGLWLGRWRRLSRSRRLLDPMERFLPDLPPGGDLEARVELLPRRRGRLDLAGVIVSRTDPLGLTRCLVRHRLPQSILILPRRYPVPSLSLPGGRRQNPGGVAMAGSVGDTAEFMSLRDYHPGDPLRRIHWRSFAKVGKPVVKEHQEEYFVRHALILDTFQQDASDFAFEEAVSLAASFACTVRTQDSLLDLLFVGPDAFVFTSGRGLGANDRMLEVLASVRPSERSFGDLADLVERRVALLSAAILVLLGWDAERRNLVARLARRGLPLTVFVVTDPDREAPEPGAEAGMTSRFRILTAGRMEQGLKGL